MVNLPNDNHVQENANPTTVDENGSVDIISIKAQLKELTRRVSEIENKSEEAKMTE